MGVSGVSMQDSIAMLSMSMRQDEVMRSVDVALLKDVLETSEETELSMVKMADRIANPDLGALVDTLA